MKTYMIVESYKHGKSGEIYRRLAERGRMMPMGLEYIDSWIEENLQKCYQVMKSENLDKIHEWMDHWNDLMDFEVIPVISSEEASKAAQ